MDWFERIRAGGALGAEVREALLRDGFAVLPGVIPAERMAGLSAAYDAAMAAADAGDVGVGRSTTRVWDVVDWGPEWDEVWMNGRLLEACAAVIGRPFQLSSTMGRTLRARTAAQAMHTDLPVGSEDGPMVGFILMVDGFTEANGGTRFVTAGGECVACGEAGAMIVFDAGVVHRHGGNATGTDRRSVQGYFVRREVKAGREVSEETKRRLGELGRWLVGEGTAEAVREGAR